MCILLFNVKLNNEYNIICNTFYIIFVFSNVSIFIEKNFKTQFDWLLRLRKHPLGILIFVSVTNNNVDTKNANIHNPIIYITRK